MRKFYLTSIHLFGYDTDLQSLNAFTGKEILQRPVINSRPISKLFLYCFAILLLASVGQSEAQTITSFTPISACRGATPTITITGTNFTGVKAVKFNGVDATSFIVVNASTITSILPSAGVSSGPIEIKTSTGNTTSTNNFSIRPVINVTITADYCIIPGKVTLKATSVPGGASYLWSTGETAQTITVDIAGDYTVSASLAGSCPGNATVAVAKELVVNGNFSNGNTGFTSDYTYYADIAGNNELVNDAGTNGYGVGTNGQLYHPLFFGQDHTKNSAGNRNFLMVNGHGKTLVVWKTSVNVIPNTTYYFSAWGMSLNNIPPYAKLQFNVNGSQVGTIGELNPGAGNNTNNGWIRFYGTWTSGPTTTSAAISITDLETALNGNDFGLDDVSFGSLSTFIKLESAPGTDLQTICANSPITNIQYSVGSTVSSPIVTGLPAGLTTSFNGVLATFSGIPTVSGTFNYTITTTGTCNPSSAKGSITINPAVSGGILNSASICSGAGGSLTLTGHAGSIQKWEISVNGGTWATIANTTTSQAYANITVSTRYRVAVNNSCGTVFSTIATIARHNFWTGGKSSDWNTPGNWSDSLLPNTSCPTVTIPQVTAPNVYPVLSSGAMATINSLVINSGASLTITGNKMQIAGTITNNGVFDVRNGALELNGTIAQTIPANAFATNKIKDLIISNNVSLGGIDSLTGTLSFGNTAKTFTTNNNLTLKSTVSGTAAVSQVINGNNITGNVTVERYISAKRGWRFLSVPTQTTQTVKAAWQEGAVSMGSNPVQYYGTQVTNAVNPTSGNGFDYYSQDGPSVKKYDITATGAYAPYRSINTAFDPIATKEGLMTFVRGDRTATGLGATPTPTILRTKGPLYIGTQAPMTVKANQFASIGNPYASPLDMRSITKSAGVNNNFYIWDARLTGGGFGAFQTFTLINGDYCPTPGGGSYPVQDGHSLVVPYNYIQSGLAFFADANLNTGGNITITENAKAAVGAATTPVALRPSTALLPDALMRTNLHAVEPDASSNLVDGVLSAFGDYSNAADNLDALKIKNFAENLALKTDDQLLVVERRQRITENDTIHLNMLKMKVKSYRFEIFGKYFNQPNLIATLEDSYLNTHTVIDINGATAYDFNVINVPGSWNPLRFMIVFKQAVVLPVTFTSIKAYQVSREIAVEWKVENETNIKQYEVERSTDGQHFNEATTVTGVHNNNSTAGYQWLDVAPAAGNNYYRIRSISVDGVTEYSSVVKVIIGGQSSQMIVYPNPVTGGNINLHFVNQPKGKYSIRLTNKLGQLMMVKQIEHQEGSSTKALQVKLLARGTYQLQVTKPDMSNTNINIHN